MKPVMIVGRGYAAAILFALVCGMPGYAAETPVAVPVSALGGPAASVAYHQCLYVRSRNAFVGAALGTAVGAVIGMSLARDSTGFGVNSVSKPVRFLGGIAMGSLAGYALGRAFTPRCKPPPDYRPEIPATSRDSWEGCQFVRKRNAILGMGVMSMAGVIAGALYSTSHGFPSEEKYSSAKQYSSSDIGLMMLGGGILGGVVGFFAGYIVSPDCDRLYKPVLDARPAL